MIILCIHAFIEFMIGLEAMNLKNLFFLGGEGREYSHTDPDPCVCK